MVSKAYPPWRHSITAIASIKACNEPQKAIDSVEEFIEFLSTLSPTDEVNLNRAGSWWEIVDNAMLSYLKKHGFENGNKARNDNNPMVGLWLAIDRVFNSLAGCQNAHAKGRGVNDTASVRSKMFISELNCIVTMHKQSEPLSY